MLSETLVFLVCRALSGKELCRVASVCVFYRFSRDEDVWREKCCALLGPLSERPSDLRVSLVGVYCLSCHVQRGLYELNVVKKRLTLLGACAFPLPFLSSGRKQEIECGLDVSF